MILYHGSNVIVKEPHIIESNRFLDFGIGFYTTTNKDQAVNFAQPNERPILLYKKVLYMPDNREKEKVVVDMIDSLRVVIRKPDVERATRPQSLA